MANSLVRVEAMLAEEDLGFPWHVKIRDSDGDYIPLAGFDDEKGAREYTEKLDTILVTLQEQWVPPDWVSVAVYLHDNLAGMLTKSDE